MQVSLYIAEADFEEISKHRKPGQTTGQFLSQALRDMAEEYRKSSSGRKTD